MSKLGVGQQQFVQLLVDDSGQVDVLLIVEHPKVYTLGTGSTLEHVKFDLDDPRFTWHRIERGGEVTHHCPGQIVAYPILNLHRHQTDLHWYLRQLEAVIILTLAEFGLKGERIAGLTGVWVDGHKLAAIGIKVRRWVTMHGLALNVNPSLAGFRDIVPCGIGDRPVGTMHQFLPKIEMPWVQSVLIQSFAQVFDLEIKLEKDFPFS
ncbi:MAG: lipoyl(octanoyl) transferase LipB [Acaryochloridaceae cyanobacterium RL_2_7]|nr:lipoyl(octanoyl) transferase LipB [Acaryochloridaceae cyanobacterium RL_2_7]